MISRSTWLHLRIPFSLYLMPVFCFAAATGEPTNWWRITLVFIIIHLVLYPASNGFNSYFDKDEESIGGLENPPPVNKELYFVSLIFDGIALLFGLMISFEFTFLLFIYGLVSKAYSHPYIRLKKNALLAWLAAGIFQGAFTYIMVRNGLNDVSSFDATDWNIFFPALLSTFMIFGFYPMTQIYQHAEDSRRGDKTISILLGIKGTFIFSAFWFLMAAVGFWFYFDKMYFEIVTENSAVSINWFWIFILFLIPLLVYFFRWFLRVLKDEKAADFHSTMMLNRIASISLILFFTFLAIYRFW
ncbi:MAG: ubiquinone biosynthesis protein UbiA [Sphingobacteriales bacterium]|nr:MAG: ubiquinone biosynthesis protein UbiA [Sphingobacteriales bacterium]